MRRFYLSSPLCFFRQRSKLKLLAESLGAVNRLHHHTTRRELRSLINLNKTERPNLRRVCLRFINFWESQVERENNQNIRAAN